MRKGKVYIIGAGPGDWELISVKGLERLKEADAIVYDFLASKDLLAFAKKGARVICAGKADGLHILEQGQINKLLYEEAKRGKTVARLKGGDPFVFSRGIEEALYLKKKKVDFEVIPGITSAFASAESFGIPLTRRGKFSSVAVLTGRKSSGKSLDAPDCDTLVYLMAVGNIKKVVEKILASGRPESTPCVFIERATTKDKRIVRGNLGNIERRAQKYSVRAPAVFIVGKIVNYGK
ncbi:MAG: uroporphyrinogen-III C-methyltransferase [Candidatus Omnitrophica bacterium]|nr:uroporphyrinogen-III C-methyltransferase [Candidatus Omnitrophota bacterium]MDD5552287.1 uroporphyrinogen-III C-methyltransferase [Candidatus Omnitrophota bacterium]